jgi:lipoyl(octanoyl) transferase
LEHYSGINPCGLNNKNITSIEDLGKNISKEELNVAIKENILRMFKI